MKKSFRGVSACKTQHHPRILRHRGSDILPPSVRELVAIHSSTEYPDYEETLASAQTFPGNIVAVAKAGQWEYSGQGNYYFGLEEVTRRREPIPAIGAHGFWRVDIGIETKIWAELGEPMPMVRG